MEELVSVIMPVYNGSEFLEDSIESVLQQTYSNLELLITDDNSSDQKVLDILRNYEKKDKRVRVFYLKENMGAGHSRNKCIEQAKGRYIAFCDSDDRWMPEKLERQIKFMEATHSRLTYSSYITCDENNEETGIYIAPEKLTYRDILRDNKVGCLTAVYDVKVLGKVFYMPTIRKRQDWGLFMGILKQCKVAYGIQDPLAYYRIRKNSISRSKLRLLNYNAKVYQHVLGFSVLKSYFYLLTLFLPTYTRKVIQRKKDSERFMKQKKKD